MPLRNCGPYTVCSAEGEAVGGREMLFDLWVCFPGGSPARVVIADIKHLKTSSKRWRHWSSPDSSGDLLGVLEKVWRTSIIPADKFVLFDRQTLKLRLCDFSSYNLKVESMRKNAPLFYASLFSVPMRQIQQPGQWPYAFRYNTAGTILASLLKAPLYCSTESNFR